jgi:hypothetical protein
MRTLSEKLCTNHDTIISFATLMQEFAANKFIYGNIQ